MAETLKTFIDKLQAEGVQAGEQAAGKIRADAEVKAKEIIQKAESQAHDIVAKAQAEIDSRRTKAENELKLAARDTVTRLQEALTDGLKAVLTIAVREKLSDADFVGKLLYEIVMQYVQADAQGTTSININVSDEMRHKLTQWAIQALHGSQEKIKSIIDLKGTLKKAGFEYSLGGGTVEVTTESTVENLLSLIGPEVRKIVSDAVKTTDK
jgi:V/A-type H+-transporting ATPase subunit E